MSYSFIIFSTIILQVCILTAGELTADDKQKIQRLLESQLKAIRDLFREEIKGNVSKISSLCKTDLNTGITNIYNKMQAVFNPKITDLSSLLKKLQRRQSGLASSLNNLSATLDSVQRKVLSLFALPQTVSSLQNTVSTLQATLSYIQLNSARQRTSLLEMRDKLDQFSQSRFVKGEKGSRGLTGDKGQKGEVSYFSNKGMITLRGPKGNKGDQGVRGFPGPTGHTGLQGIPGVPGLPGAKGDSGLLDQRIDKLDMLKTLKGRHDDHGLLIRLVNGGDSQLEHNSSRGRVELQRNGVWGTICNSGWFDPEIRNAQVVCRMLNFRGARSVFYGITANDSVPIWLSIVKCLGHETNLFQCALSQWGDADKCSHYDDVSVECLPEM